MKNKIKYNNLNKYNLIFLVAILISSCSLDNSISNQSSNEYKFEKIILQNYSEEGKLKYTIKSTKAIISNGQDQISTISPIIILYKDNVPQYIMKARDGLIDNLNQTIYLLGKVTMVDKQDETTMLFADKMKWEIRKAIISFTDNVKLNHNNSSIIANRADYNRNSNEILFYDIYTNKDRSIIDEENSTTVGIGVASEKAKYNIDSRKIEFFSQKSRVQSTIKLN